MSKHAGQKITIRAEICAAIHGNKRDEPAYMVKVYDIWGNGQLIPVEADAINDYPSPAPEAALSRADDHTRPSSASVRPQKLTDLVGEI